MNSLVQDLRFALRSFRKKPAFVAVVIGTFALGIGANSAVFSIVDGVLLRSLPYDQPERIVRVWSANRETGDRFLDATFADVVAFREQNHSFSEVAAFSIAPRDLNDTYGNPSRATVTRLSRGLFGALGVVPELGRDFRAEEFESTARVVILSNGIWLNRYGGDAGILSHSIRLEDEVYTVIGIMPRWYDYPHGSDMWRPFTDTEYQDDDRELHVVARLAEGVSIGQATADVEQIAARVEELNADNQNITAWVQPLHAMLVRDAQKPLVVLLGAVGLVLAIACANIANLLLGNATSRQQEIAVRVALGASRARLVRQLMTETLMLASMGCVAGLLLGRWALDMIVAISPSDTPRIFEVALDGRVVTAMALVTAVASVAFGLFPALQASRPTFLNRIREGGRTGAGVGRQRVQRRLVVAQIAISTVMVIGAGLLVATFNRQLHLDRGFLTEHLLTVPVHQTHDSDLGAADFFDQLLARVRQLPSVQAAAMSSTSPMEPRGFGMPVHVHGTPEPTGAQPRAIGKVASPNFFATAGIRFRAGRSFVEGEATGEVVAIVNAAFAETFFEPGANPLNRLVDMGNTTVRLVGVVDDVIPEAGALARPTMYFPFVRFQVPGMTLLLRTDGDPTPLIPTIRSLVWDLDPNIPLDGIATVEQTIHDTVASPRFNMLMVTSIASLALVIAAVGIYGVMAHTVAQRNREMGVRLALGASHGAILRQVLHDGFRMAATGVGLGVAGALVLTRLLESLLYGVSPTDPFTFSAVIVTIGMVSAIACYVPARRATRVDPLEALRAE
ncbi:MAG: ABC transporter permease [Gemmatimonadetes bacterium]|nr:ABC transporter permease [Gemmatimonadota bacterium]